MKKFLKVFITVLLVLGVIGGTVFFFFRKHKEKNNTTDPILALADSEVATKLQTDLTSISDDRMTMIAATNVNLNNVIYNLSSYYIENNTQIKDEKIATQVRAVNSSRSLLTAMINEYNIKKESTYFNKTLGANDLFNQSCLYLVQYATLANMINAHISNVDKTADAKFSVLEIYCNVVINDFSSTKVDSGVVKLNSSLNIAKANSIIIFDANSSYVIINNNFTLDSSEFIKCYNSCDKLLFAKNFAGNIESVNSAEQALMERLATYYFKLIIG